MIGGDIRDDPLPGNLDRDIGLPLGAQLHADAQQVLRGPGAVISTTGADGTADMWLEPGSGYQVCVVSPDAEGLIAGCEYDFLPDTNHTDWVDGLRPLSHDVAMVYFSHGRAYLGVVRDTQRAYFWFQQIAESVFGPDWSAPAAANLPTPSQPRPGQATIDFVSSLHTNRVEMALIKDSQVGAWWDAIHAATIGEYQYQPAPDAATVESSPALLVPLQPDPTVFDEFLATVTVDAGVYLVCWLNKRDSSDGVSYYGLDVCVYEEFPAGSHSYLQPGYGETYRYLTNIRGYVPEQ